MLLNCAHAACFLIRYLGLLACVLACTLWLYVGFFYLVRTTRLLFFLALVRVLFCKQRQWSHSFAVVLGGVRLDACQYPVLQFETGITLRAF